MSSTVPESNEGMNTQSAIGPSRPLDVHRWADYPELNQCLSDLVAEIEAMEGRLRRRNIKTAKSFRNAVRSIVLDLYVAWCADPSLEIAVQLSKGYFTRPSRYKALFLKYDSFAPAFHGLEKLGYLRIVRAGFKDRISGRGFLTRIQPTEKIINLLVGKAKFTLARVSGREGGDARETIVLRDSDKKPVSYVDTNRTNAMREDLLVINGLLSRSWIDLYVPDAEFEKLPNKMGSVASDDPHKPASLDFLNRSLVRIFNNESWDQGGRFYRGWWQGIPSEYRKFLTIDGKHTSELDYSGMHVAMLYAEVGQILVGDAYDIGQSNVPRDVIKRTFNKMLNARGRITPVLGYDPVAYGLTWKELQEAIRRRHTSIATYFHSGRGLFLQNRDAEIANRILMMFARKGYVCLPVHDSFIVHHALKDELRGAMLREFTVECGADIVAKAKPSFLMEYIPPKESSMNHGIALLEALGEAGSHQGYFKRQMDWDARMQM